MTKFHLDNTNSYERKTSSDFCCNPMCSIALPHKGRIYQRKVCGCLVFCCSVSCLEAFEKLLMSPKVSEGLQ